MEKMRVGVLPAGWIHGAVAGVLFGADLLIKALVRGQLPLGVRIPLLPHLLTLTHVENPGISFSMLGNLPAAIRAPLLGGGALVIMAVLGWVWWSGRRAMNAWQHWGFVCVMGGASGNVADRLARGSVTDYLLFHFYQTSFFVNNLADILISTGLGAYLLGALLQGRQRNASQDTPS